MFLTNTQSILGMDRYQGPRWVSVDEPRKSMSDEIFRYLHGNVYYTQEWRLANDVNMLMTGNVSMTLWFDDMADVRAFPDGSIKAVNATEHIIFIYQCRFSHMRFTDDDGNLDPYLQDIWSNDIEKARDAASSPKRYGMKRQCVNLEFIGLKEEDTRFKNEKKEPHFTCFEPNTPDKEFNAVCRNLGKQKYFETRNLEQDEEKIKLGNILTGIVSQCNEVYSRWPNSNHMPRHGVRRIFYLPGPEG